MNTEPINWPTSESTWWWMRLRMSRRSKWRVWLVKMVRQSDTEYALPFDHNDGFARGVCERWEARFLPAEPPPSPEDWTR